MMLASVLVSLALTTSVAHAGLAVSGTTTLPDLQEPAPTGQRSPQDFAVVIGVEDYSDVPDVPFAKRDALAFETWAMSTRGIPEARVRRLLDARAYEIESALDEAGKSVGKGGRVWVYFAGHGAMDPGGTRRLLLGRDAATDPGAFARFAVSVDDVQRRAGAGGGEVLMVLDACYNGGGRAGEGSLTAGKRLAVPTSLLTPTAGSVEWAATGPQEMSGPLPAAQQGLFTYFAVGALRGWADGEVDGTRDGMVTGEEAQRYVRRVLGTVQGGNQTPQLLAAQDASTLVLARGVKEVGPARDALVALRGGGANTVQVATTTFVTPPAVTGGSTAGGDVSADVAALKRLKALREAREAKLTELARAKAAEGAAAWTELSSVLSDGSAAEIAVVEKYVKTWTDAKVWVDDAEGRTERAVVVASIDAAKAWLAKAGKGAVGSDWVSPTLGTMKWIPAGTFLMGSPASEAGRYDDEGPQHRVTLTKGFWMMEHEVTQGEWQAVMGSNPAKFTQCGVTCPVEQVSWDDAVEFARRVSARDGVTYTLPTEAQWEYAARGNGTGVYAGGNEVGAVAWYTENSGSRTHPVCQKARNGFGLCDMSGNVLEWTADWFGTYPSSAVTDPKGAASGASRVRRGGSWRVAPRFARVARRFSSAPANRSDYLGFRFSRTVP